MQLIDINFIGEPVQLYTGMFYSTSEPQDIYTLEDLMGILEQLSQYLELSNAA